MATVTQSDLIAGVYVVEPVVHDDPRGIFVETYRREWFPGVPEMIQMNRGDRQRGAIVGMHYHFDHYDYWYVPVGSARIVLHDLRVGSPTDGASESTTLGARDDGTHDHRGLLIPPGVAHGYAAVTDMTLTYLVDAYYDPTDELGVPWDDPMIGADWGITSPILSARDLAHPPRADLTPAQRPPYVAPG